MELEQRKMEFRMAEYNLLEVWPQKLKLAQEQNATLESRLKFAQKMLQIHKEALRSYRDRLPKNSKDIQNRQGLNDSDIDAEIHLRTVELQNLKRKYQQSQELYDRKLISLTDLQDAEARYLSALASQPSRLSEIERQTIAIQDHKRQILVVSLHDMCFKDPSKGVWAAPETTGVLPGSTRDDSGLQPSSACVAPTSSAIRSLLSAQAQQAVFSERRGANKS